MLRYRVPRFLIVDSGITAPFIGSGVVVHEPLLGRGLAPTILSNVTVAYAANIGRGLEVGALSSVAQLFTPALAVGVALPVIGSAAVTYVPTLGGGIEFPYIGSTENIVVPVVGRGLIVPYLESVGDVDVPVLGRSLFAAYIGTAVDVYGPTVGRGIEVPVNLSSFVLYSPTIQYTALVPGFLDSTGVLYVPTVAAPLSLTVPFTSSGARIWLPDVRRFTLVDWTPQVQVPPDVALVHTMVFDALRTAFMDRPQRLSVGQIYPLDVQDPKVVPPYIVYTVGEVEVLRTLAGYGGRSNSQVEFVVWHKSYLEAKRICTQILQVLWDYRKGFVGAYNVGEDAWDLETELFACSLNVSFWHG